MRPQGTEAMNATLEDVRRYVAELAPEVRTLYAAASAIAKETPDTLSEEYQLAAAIEALFWERADRQRLWQMSEG